MIIIIYSEKKDNRIFRVTTHSDRFIPIVSDLVEINYRLVKKNGVDQKVIENPKNFIWKLGLGPAQADPYPNDNYLNDLDEKIKLVEWLWQYYWIFEQNSILDTYGNHIVKDMIEYELDNGKDNNPSSITQQYIQKSKLTKDSFLELHKLNNEMLYSRKLSAFNILTETQQAILISDNPRETLAVYMKKYIFPF